ncbi:hydroxyethylthiazole kinase [Desulfocurvibacter africanus]|uniref:hydroxyethylthiazole kinase n=2 Tax=Desulfocurvibacter africanus TaxID=873 RepID=UPI000403F64C|nr:hydroxyethylthiazole kinase [Desulfocurvibacter africanus]
MFDVSTVWAHLCRVREKNPLVLNVTNNVVTNTTANALLALGASPAMTHAPDDAGELASLADAVVLNIGTPASSYIESMFKAGQAANSKGIPVVLDPVAAGATAYRREVVAELLKRVRLAAIRGNASEILYVAGEQGSSKGADSTNASEEALDAARALAERLGAVVCVSGARDVITDGRSVLAVDNGHPMMTKVTGLGCTATALVGAFAACAGGADDMGGRLAATTTAMAVMGLAGEVAAQDAPGPGTLQVRFLDSLYAMDEELIRSRLKLAAL